MRTLGIETSGVVGSVALVEDGRVLAWASHSAPNRHAEETLHLIEKILQEAGWEKNSLDRIVVGVGPGSFTGVRVGLSLGMGLSLGWGVPALGVSSLLALSQTHLLEEGGGVQGSQGRGDAEQVEAPLRVVLRDARRDEYFFAIYDAQNQAVVQPCAIPRATAAKQVREQVGERAFILLGESVEGLPAPALPQLRDPDARLLALLSEDAKPEDHPLVPEYIRGPGATKPSLPPSPLEEERTSG